MELAVNGDGGGVVCSVQAVGLQVLVAKEPRGANRTPEMCGQPDPSCRVCLREISLGGTRGRYIGAGVCINRYEDKTLFLMLFDLFTNKKTLLDYNHNFGCQLDDTFSSAF